MSKKKKLNLSKKQEDTSQKDSEKSLPENVVSPSLQATTLENPSADFQKAIDESKNHIAAADAEKIKKKRGRQPFPRDAQGNIIRTAEPQATPLALNQASVAETKALLSGFVVPVASGALVKFALDDERAAIPEEQKDPWAQATAEELETWFPGLSNKYARLGMVIGLPVMWFVNARNLRVEKLKELIESEKNKREPKKDGSLPESKA